MLASDPRSLFHANYVPFVSDTFFAHVPDFEVLDALNKTECSIVSSYPIQSWHVVVCNQSRSQRHAFCSDQVASSSKCGFLASFNPVHFPIASLFLAACFLVSLACGFSAFFTSPPFSIQWNSMWQFEARYGLIRP